MKTKNVNGRLVPHWTPTAAAAFGRSGAKGRAGELFLTSVLRGWGWTVVDLEDNKAAQLRGWDLMIKAPNWRDEYSVDVKANMYEDGRFYVDTSPTGWLFNPRKDSDRIWHVHVDTRQMAWYNREQMKRTIRRGHASDSFEMVRPNQFDFVSYRKV